MDATNIVLTSAEQEIKSMEPTITKDLRVREMYKMGWEPKLRKYDITEIVIHATAGSTTAEGILLWMLGGEKASDYKQGIGLFHYLIDRDQDNIIEVIDPNYWTWHSTSASHDQYTIGIEMVNPSKTNRMPFTEIQYTSLFNLIFNKLLIDYPTIKSIVSHDFNANKYSGKPPKPCPGAFEWTRLEAELTKHNISYTNSSPQSYEIS
jgi:hypothetical protein